MTNTPTSTSATDPRLRSPVFRVLSLSDHRTLSCIEAALAGAETAEVGYPELAEAGGVSHNRIAGSLRVLIGLGLISISQAGRGRGLRHVFRRSDAWRGVATLEDARAIAKAARSNTGSLGRIAGPVAPIAASNAAAVEIDAAAGAGAEIAAAAILKADPVSIRIGGYMITIGPAHVEAVAPDTPVTVQLLERHIQFADKIGLKRRTQTRAGLPGKSATVSATTIQKIAKGAGIRLSAARRRPALDTPRFGSFPRRCDRKLSAPSFSAPWRLHKAVIFKSI